MYKNQLQELAQRSCFNLPSYTCIREGPDHAPRFKAAVNFNGEVFESPSFCTTLRQAEHAAAEVALNALSHRGPSHSLAARILDETGVYKNLLQEIAQRVGAPLPAYTTVRSGLGHLPVFTCTVELAGITFTGEPAKNKKQAEKNAALAAWSSLKQLARQEASSSIEPVNNDEQEQMTIARALLNYRLKEKMAMADNPNAAPFPKKFPIQPERKPSSIQPFPSTGSKILPLIRPKSTQRFRLTTLATNEDTPPSPSMHAETRIPQLQKFPAAGAAPYVPVHHFRTPYHGMAPPVTIRTAVPVFSAPPLQPPPGHQLPPVMGPPIRMASPVRIRPVVPVFAAPLQVPSVAPVIPTQVKEPPIPVHIKESAPIMMDSSSAKSPARVKELPPVAVDSNLAKPVPQMKESPPVVVDSLVTKTPVVEGSPAAMPMVQVKESPPAIAADAPPAKPQVVVNESPPVDGADANEIKESAVTGCLRQLKI